MTTWSNDETGGSIFSSDETSASSILAQLAASTGSSLVGFKQSGTGALTETVSQALARMVHSAQYSSNANFETARSALSGEMGFATVSASDHRAWISTDSVDSRFYRADSTFSGTVDPGTFIGYNLTGFGQIEDTAKSSLMIGFEANYNDGSKRQLEYHVDMAGPNQSFVRPFSAIYDLTGASANKISSVQLFSQKDVDILAAATGTMTLLALNFTVGTAGATFTMTGNYASNGRVLLGSVTDTDSSSYVQLGAGDSGATSRTTILCRAGGFASPSNANANSDGDKLTLWNTSTFKAAVGLDGSGNCWFQANGSSAGSFRWYGTTSSTPALQMTLSSASALTVVGAFGCNGATARTAAASGGALNAYGAGANGLDSGANMSALHALVVAMRAALVNNGIMS